jgi:hypothetical protein
MKIPKTVIQTIMVAVTAGTIASCTKSVASKSSKEANTNKAKTDSTLVYCPACGMG